MKINLKNKDQISQMRVAGQLAAEVLEMITPFVVPGVRLRSWIRGVITLL